MVGRVVWREQVALREGVAGKGRIAGRGRIAAPLLGGVRGWVYFNDTSYTGISGMKYFGGGW
jgi:hypothetical protein